MNPQQKSDDPIKHVVLLLLENHPFDQMLGCFKQLYPTLEGIDPANPYSNEDDKGNEFKQKPTDERQMILDPRHEVNHVAAQLKDHNGGFVLDFVQTNPIADDEQRQFIMGYYRRGFLPALHRLAEEFTICDHWFSSLPGPTWPNRFFALTGTSSGRVNMPEDGEHTVDFGGWFQQKQFTIFDRLNDKGISWKVYFHDIPQSICLEHQRRPEMTARYFPILQFLYDAAGDEADFPAFCFVEPDYNGATENDDHPPHDVMKAQKLLADVYNAIRANDELWKSTLLVVFYDEHGGFYDHLVPPAVIPPDADHKEYTFDQLGLRVPALLISPWARKTLDSTQYDHTSLLKYLVEKWGLDSLGNRTANATPIQPKREQQPRLDTISSIELTPDQLRSPRPDVEEAAVEYLSSHHKAIAWIGEYLKRELIWTNPRWYAWLYYPLEKLIHCLSDIADRFIYGKEGAALLRYQRAKGQWSLFRKRRRTQAIPALAKTIRDETNHEHARRFAAETLSYLADADKKLYAAADPIDNAKKWLDENGY
jgi:phospholipase C